MESQRSEILSLLKIHIRHNRIWVRMETDVDKIRITKMKLYRNGKRERAVTYGLDPG
jgi:hypothetical protein